MDDAALYDLARGTALNSLDRAAHMLDLVGQQDEPAGLLASQLAPHMFDCALQIQTVPIFALRCVMPMMDRPWALAAGGQSREDLAAKVAQAKDQISAVNLADFKGVAGKRIQHTAGDAALDQRARDYLVDFAIPNLWFHLTMAYAALRAAGVAIGKADFDGLHAYRRGFHFV